MDASYDDVEAREQLVILVKSAIFQDVDFDAGKDPKRCKLGIQLGDNVELGTKSLAV
jgi:hypothetical protein